LAATFAAISPLEAVSVAFAIAYLVLAIRQNSLCWPAALISVGLSLILFYEARLYMEAALQIFYVVMAIYGWHQWRRGGGRHSGLAVSRWSVRAHVACAVLIASATAVFGLVLVRNTDAALPFLDSFTTVGALVATYMVAKKVLENWLYWFVIDAASVYLYGSRGLLLYAALFVAYLVLIVIGYRRWAADWRAQQSGAGSVHA
jgi:nicotinamide mononucleotide transporter